MVNAFNYKGQPSLIAKKIKPGNARQFKPDHVHSPSQWANINTEHLTKGEKNLPFCVGQAAQPLRSVLTTTAVDHLATPYAVALHADKCESLAKRLEAINSKVSVLS